MQMLHITSIAYAVTEQNISYSQRAPEGTPCRLTFIIDINMWRVGEEKVNSAQRHVAPVFAETTQNLIQFIISVTSCKTVRERNNVWWFKMISSTMKKRSITNHLHWQEQNLFSFPSLSLFYLYVLILRKIQWRWVTNPFRLLRNVKNKMRYIVTGNMNNWINLKKGRTKTKIK